MKNSTQISKLKNCYLLMRHGQSYANQQGIIVSHPENGLRVDYGLTDAGRQRVVESVQAVGLGPDTVIYSSDFSRTHQTALVVQGTTQSRELFLSAKLRERSFGSFELSSIHNYDAVWANDRLEIENVDGVETVGSVLDRARSLIYDLEQKYQAKSILLVSHDDLLSILDSFYSGHDVSEHMDSFSFANAEIRALGKKRITN